MSTGTVFVTGASTGIGHATALRLANAGFTVIPGLRRDQPLPAPVAKPVLLDLNDPDSIGPAAKEVIDRANGKLAGLVNNAGMNVSGVFESLPLEDWRHQFEVNLFGQLALSQSLLPALISAKGRLITVGSIGGRMSVPFLSPYSASKFAVRAWMDAMRAELKPQGVRASLIEPGAIATPLWEKGTSAAVQRIEEMPADIRSRYESGFNGALKIAKASEKHAIPPERVAKAIEHALTARRPKGRYLVGPDAHLQAVLAAMPTRVFDAVIGALVRPVD